MEGKTVFQNGFRILVMSRRRSARKSRIQRRRNKDARRNVICDKVKKRTRRAERRKRTRKAGSHRDLRRLRLRRRLRLQFANAFNARALTEAADIVGRFRSAQRSAPLLLPLAANTLGNATSATTHIKLEKGRTRV